jgi:hypothetical protein
MLTLLTATGARPEAWRICQRLAERQTYGGPVHWIVVDDGPEAQLIDFDRKGWTITMVYPRPVWQPGDNTQARNLKEGLRHLVPGDRLVIWEDDDAYHPQWLERVDKWLDTHDMAGEGPARYYNIKTKRARKLNNHQHASLCCTAMKGAAIDAFAKELKPGVQFIDINLWKNFRGSKALYPTEMVTGIKGMPGRGGIGMGHKPDFQGQIDDTGSILRQWTGINADLYV